MKDYISINKKAYDKLAKEYQTRMKRYVKSDHVITTPFIDYLKKVFPKVKVLELGPGSGLNLSFFEKERFSTWAIDISKNIIQVSKKNSPKTTYMLGDFLEYNFKELRFEGIFAKAFIHLFPTKDALKVFEKIKKLLVSDGLLFLATTIHPKPEEGYFEKEDYEAKLKRFRKKWTEKELIETLRKMGFKIIHKDYHRPRNENKVWINILLKKI